MASITLWLFVLALGVNLGAGLYEARIVVPLWVRGVPGTLREGDPFGRVAIDAGIRFWAYTTPATAIVAILALVFGFHTPLTERAWRTFATIAELVAVATTLLYFRPTLVRLFMGHGAGLSDDAIRSAVHRWTMWNRVRIVLSFVAWCAALYALTLNHH